MVVPSSITKKINVMETKKRKKTIVLTVATILTVIAINSISIAQNLRSNNGVEFKECLNCQVSGWDIIAYLENEGYTNISLSKPIGATCDVVANTDYSYDTNVICTETAIIGHEDLQ